MDNFIYKSDWLCIQTVSLDNGTNELHMWTELDILRTLSCETCSVANLNLYKFAVQLSIVQRP